MVFEDLHWADAGTLDFIDHLLDWARTIPLMIITLARPELLERRPDWGAGRRTFIAIGLEPLPEPAMRELLAGLVPGLPESAVRLVSSGPTGSRCTRSRPCGCWSRSGGSSCATASTSRSAT